MNDLNLTFDFTTVRTELIDPPQVERFINLRNLCENVVYIGSFDNLLWKWTPDPCSKVFRFLSI
jgi:hypothetical protein